jgi:hypothetical protein
MASTFTGDELVAAAPPDELLLLPPPELPHAEINTVAHAAIPAKAVIFR